LTRRKVGGRGADGAHPKLERSEGVGKVEKQNQRSSYYHAAKNGKKKARGTERNLIVTKASSRFTNILAMKRDCKEGLEASTKTERAA